MNLESKKLHERGAKRSEDLAGSVGVGNSGVTACLEGKLGRVSSVADHSAPFVPKAGKEIIVPSFKDNSCQ